MTSHEWHVLRLQGIGIAISALGVLCAHRNLPELAVVLTTAGGYWVGKMQPQARIAQAHQGPVPGERSEDPTPRPPRV